jgi:hypothetical protein
MNSPSQMEEPPQGLEVLVEWLPRLAGGTRRPLVNFRRGFPRATFSREFRSPAFCHDAGICTIGQNVLP